MPLNQIEMLNELRSLLVIQSSVDEALTETARAYKLDKDDVRSAAEERFGDLDKLAWKVSSTGYVED